MIDWLKLSNMDMIDEIISVSNNQPVLIFKHSTVCSISSIAKLRLEDDWDIGAIKTYLLDLITYRGISNTIADKFQVQHESPQILLISKGECIHDASHFDISKDEILDVLEYHKLSVTKN